jgi:hypothetical protein
MKRLYTVFLTGALSLTACGVGQEVNQRDRESSTMNQKAIIGEAPKDNPSTQINRAVIIDNTLELEVSYSGGCEEQVFDLVGNEMIMKSFPPQRSVVLVRDSKGDDCREWITKTIIFDITELHHSKKVDAEILLRLEGFDGELRYIYRGE